MKKETGILFIETEQEKNGFLKQGMGLCVLLLYYYLGAFGCTLGMLSLFPVSYDRTLMWGGMIGLGLIFFAICSTGKYAPLFVLLTALVYGGLLYQNWEHLLEGASVILETISDVVVYHRGGRQGVLQIPTRNQEEAAYCLLAFHALWSSLLFAGLVLKGGRLFAVIAVGFVFGTGLILGQVPDFLPTCLMVFGLAGAFSTEGMELIHGQMGAAVLIGLLILLLMSFGMPLLEPVVEPWFADREKIRESLQGTSIGQGVAELLTKLRTPMAKTGVDDGQLDNAEFISQSDEIMLRVQAELLPRETVYYQGYTGGTYTGDAWEEVDDEWNDRVREEYFQRISQTAYEQGDMGPYSMEVTPLQNEEEYLYRPYFAALELEAEGSFTYRYFPREEVSDYYWSGNLGTLGSEEYRTFVYENYLSYPEERLERLKALCDANPQENVTQVEEFIYNYLTEHTSYNLNVGAYPADEDFSEYFLFERQQGYCVHYATTAALMFRMYGIPSRYVTGYVGIISDFAFDEGIYTADIPANRAHAWTEIYINGQGWIPVETTPGYAQEVSERQAIEEEDTERVVQTETTVTESETESMAGETERWSEPAETEKEMFSIPGVIKGILAVVTAVLLMLLAILMRRCQILRKRSKAGVRELFYDICGMLECLGFEEELEEEAAFVNVAIARFQWIEGDDFALLVHLAMKANFSREEITKEELLFTRTCYRLIRLQVREKLSGMKKIWFDFGKGY